MSSSARPCRSRPRRRHHDAPRDARALAELGIDCSQQLRGARSSAGWCSTRLGDVIARRALSADGDLLEPPVRDAGRRLRRRATIISARTLLRRRADGGRRRGAVRRRHVASTADVLVGADGFRSAVRAQFLPRRSRAMPATSPGAAWPTSGRWPPVLPQRFCQPSLLSAAGEQFLGYPVAGPGNDLRPGHRSWNIVWYRPAEEDSRAAAAADRREQVTRTSCRSRRR